MNLKVLVTSLVLGISSVAAAKPNLDVRVDADLNLNLRDRRGPWRPTWEPVSQMVTAKRRTIIDVRENRDNLSSIRLQLGSGATYVYGVTLHYDNGTKETLSASKWLYSGAPNMTFDLKTNKGGLDRIVVLTWTNGFSTFQVHGKAMRRVNGPPIIGPQPPPPPPMPVPVGLVIAKDVSFAHSSYLHLPVGVEKGSFSKLRIESSGASSFIGSVYVTLATGKQQKFDLNRTMYRSEILDLDLDGRIAQGVIAVTLMADTDVRAVGPSASKLTVSLL